MLSAVIFDFDGVIVDTEPFHHHCFLQVLEPFGISFGWDEYLSTYIGFDDRDAFREAFRRAGRGDELTPSLLGRLVDEKSRIFPEVAASRAVPYPGVVELIHHLAGQLPLGLCSGALRSDVVPILSRLGVLDHFSVMVTADDVAVSKPDPEGYRRAAALLAERYPSRRITPGRCCAIEDTPAGIASAKGAGLLVVAVTNSHPAKRLAGADLVVDSLAGVTRGVFEELTAGS